MRKILSPTAKLVEVPLVLGYNVLLYLFFSPKSHLSVLIDLVAYSAKLGPFLKLFDPNGSIMINTGRLPQPGSISGQCFFWPHNDFGIFIVHSCSALEKGDQVFGKICEACTLDIHWESVTWRGLVLDLTQPTFIKYFRAYGLWSAVRSPYTLGASDIAYWRCIYASARRTTRCSGRERLFLAGHH